MVPHVTVRRLADDDERRQAVALRREAFGHARPSDDTLPPPLPGAHAFGVFDGEQLVAHMVDREFDSWFSGATVPTSGIAAVTVVAESRGRGLLTPMFKSVLESARQRGAVISTLYPTAAGIYRRFGYEIVGALDTVELPTAALAAVSAPTTLVTTRRARAEDVPSIRAVHEAWSSTQNGPLTRRGPSFPGGSTADDELLGAYTGITLALDEAGAPVGYAAWSRSRGYGEGSRLEVDDLVSTTSDAARALLSVLGSFASVCATTRVRTSGTDPFRLQLRTSAWPVVESEPYMLRLLDLAGAFAARPFPRHLGADLTFTFHDELLDDLDGTWRLQVAHGRATCDRVSRAATGGPSYTGRGLALVYAGAQSTANVRAAGLMTGADADDVVWDTLFGGRQLHVRDYF
jgi:predicted acetyltransferase